MKQNNKGITLIALVITIIILIILAAISISMLLGDEGIIERAKRASRNYTIAADEEHSLLDYLTGTLEDNDVVEEARGDGTLSGEGTESNPYLIQSIEDLVYLSNQVKGGDTYTGKYFKLEVNLDFKDRRSYLNPDSKDFGNINEDTVTGTLFEELTTGKGFSSIGVYSYQFEGIFDGNNKSIRNMQGRSLFGYSQNSTIKNLKMLDVNISYSQGGIVDYVYGSITIENCKTSGEMTGYGRKGGVLGYTYSTDSNASIKVYSTSNGINISGASSDGAGGIIAYLQINAEFENCSNTGNITATSSAGGILGYLRKNAEFTNCSNTGKITGTYGYIGGIIGDTYGASGATNITNCYNKGEITGATYIGGIAGRGFSGSISHCYNEGTVNSTGLCGGIVGSPNGPEITYCYNTGTIKITGSSPYEIGGIIAVSSYNTNIKYCYNTGDIIAETNSIGSTGGICGTGNGTIENCYNIGNITIKSSGSIYHIGGIQGNGSNSKKIINCYNTGKITATSTSTSSNPYSLGGIVGEGGTIENCYNIGEIETNSTNSQIGSVAGKPSSITDCYYLDGTYEKATGGSITYEVTSVEDEDAIKSIMNTKLATIEGWKVSTTGGYPELEF